MKKRQPTTSIKNNRSIHDELSVWGYLTQLEEGKALGILSTSHSLKSLGELGVKISSQATGKLPWSGNLEKLDELIGQLIRTKPAWGKAVKAYYTSDVVKNKVRKIAAQQQLSKSTFHDRLQNGRQWIDGEMKH